VPLLFCILLFSLFVNNPNIAFKSQNAKDMLQLLACFSPFLTHSCVYVTVNATQSMSVIHDMDL